MIAAPHEPLSSLQSQLQSLLHGARTYGDPLPGRDVGTLSVAGTLYERNDPENMMAGVAEKGPFTVEATFTARCRPDDFGSSRNVCD